MRSQRARLGGVRAVVVVLVAAFIALSAGPANASLIDTFDPPNGAVTSTQAGTAPPATVLVGGPTGQFLRLVNDGVNSQSNQYSYSRTDVGAYSTIVAQFDFAGYSADQAADGFSFSFLPTATYGASGAGPNLSESPNAAGVLGIGFHTYPGSGGANNISLHWNGAQLLNAAVNTSQVNFTNGVWNRAVLTIQSIGPGGNMKLDLIGDVNGTPQTVTVFNRWVFGASAFENRVHFGGRTGGADMNVDLDNVNVLYSNPTTAPPTIGPYSGTLQDFDSLGTTPFQLNRYGAAFGAQLVAGGPTGNFLRLVDQNNGESNQVAFDRTNTGLYNRIVADWDFSILTGADGGSFVLANTGWDGNTGPVRNPDAWETPNIANVFGIGFGIYPNRFAVTLNWNGAQVASATTFDYRNAWRHAHAVIDYVSGGANVSLDINGTPIFTNQFIAGMTPYEGRVAFGGRTGGENTNFDLDNISVQWSNPVAEPTNPFYWRGITGDYGTAANWTNSILPTGNDNAVIDRGVATGTVNLQGTGSLTVTGTGGLNVGSLQVAGAAATTGTMTVAGNAQVYSGGDLYLANGAGAVGNFTIRDNARLTVNGTHTVVGRGGVGYVVQNGGAVSLRRLFISEFAGSAGSTWDLNAGTLTASDVVNIGRTQQGTFTQNGGTFTTSTDLYVANAAEGGAGATGTYNMNAGVLTVGGTHTVVGRGGVGQFVQNGGTVNLRRLFVAEFAGSAGSTYTMNGGTLNLTDFMGVGRSEAGVFTQTGGTVNEATTVFLGNGGVPGTYNMQGGTLNTATLRREANGAFNFTGGTLHAGTIDFTGSTFINNGGRLSPGTSPGLTTILGNYVQTAAGTYEIELGGYTPVTQHDQVHVTGTATLDGWLDISLINSFQPALGDKFNVLIADLGIIDQGLDLRFASPANPWFRYDIISGGGTVQILQLTAVPEPGAFALLAIGAGGLALSALRRRRER